TKEHPMLARTGEHAVNDRASSWLWAPAAPLAKNDQATHVSRLFRVAVEHVSHAMLVLGETGDVLVANRPPETPFAFPPTGLVGQRIERLLPDLTHAQWKRLWFNPSDEGLCALNGRRSDGATVPFEIGVNVFVEGRTRYLIASITDLAERRKLETQ